MSIGQDPRVGHPCFGSDEQWHHTPGDPETCEVCGGWMPDELLRALLDDEPPVGSVVAVNGCPPWLRRADGSWTPDGLDDGDWLDLWTSDLRVLRWGWGS